LPCKFHITSMVDLRDDIKQFHPGYMKLFDEVEWKQDFLGFCAQEKYKGIPHKQRTWDPTIKKLITKTTVDMHPTSKMYLKWLQQNFNFNETNEFIEKIKQMPDDIIDTAPKEFNENLNWHNDQYRIKGI